MSPWRRGEAGHPSWPARLPAVDEPLPHRVRRDLARTLALDAEQLAVLDVAGENRQAVVEGGAGTGKTVVARELCLRAAATGQRVRYLCFTEALAAHMERSFASARAAGLDLAARPIRPLAARLAAAPAAAYDPRRWPEAARRAERRVREDRLHPDLTVVDEAQDLEPADWEVVRALCETPEGDGPPRRGLWIFLDAGQRFWPEREGAGWPGRFDSLPHLVLRRQQRLPATLVAAAAAYGPHPTRDPLRPGPGLRMRHVGAAPTEVAVEAALREILGTGLDPRHVAVLSLASRSRSRIVTRPRLAEIPCVQATEAQPPGTLLVDTALRFKGLDRPVVLLCELAAAWHQYDLRMRVALTRATTEAVLLVSDAATAHDPRLAPADGPTR